MTKAVNIVASVGLGGVNQPHDVRTIQTALNSIPPMQGGASPNLSVDGLAGPKTCAAIGRFQTVQFPGQKSDSRVDPGKKTINRINDLLAKEGIFSSLAGITLKAAPSTAQFQSFAPLDWWIPTLASVRAASSNAQSYMEDAVKRLKIVRDLYATGQQTKLLNPPHDKYKHEADWHFKFNRDSKPVLAIDTVMRVYHRSIETLKEANQDIYPLYRPYTGTVYPDARARAPPGGYAFPKDEIGRKITDRYIYIGSKFSNADYPASILIHEMAHFCGIPGDSGPINHMAHPDPMQLGTRMEHGKYNYDEMTPAEAVQNAFSYQAYADPALRFIYTPPPYVPAPATGVFKPQKPQGPPPIWNKK